MATGPRVNDGVARVARTATFASAAEVIVQFIEAFITDFNEAQHVAALGMLLLTINSGVVVIEHFKQAGLFLRKVPTPDVPAGGE